MPTSSCQNHRVALSPHDVLVVGTDGLNEGFNASGEMFGYERLLKTVEMLASQPADQIGRGYSRSSSNSLMAMSSPTTKRSSFSEELVGMMVRHDVEREFLLKRRLEVPIAYV